MAKPDKETTEQNNKGEKSHSALYRDSKTQKAEVSLNYFIVPSKEKQMVMSCSSLFWEWECECECESEWFGEREREEEGKSPMVLWSLES